MTARRMRSTPAKVARGGVALATIGLAALSGCYSGASGSNPPTDTFYYPVGLAVSPDGTTLYVANSDFDLQWNGGTLQSYNLANIRLDTATLIEANFDPVPADATRIAATGRAGGGALPFDPSAKWLPGCQNRGTSNPIIDPNGARAGLGQACAPPMLSRAYRLQSAIIGAFATDVQLASSTTHPELNGKRIYVPVRGDATVTWADVTPGGPLTFDCGAPDGGRCNAAHHVGSYTDSFDTRSVTMPGEPFAMAQTPDGSAIAITHQTSGNTSLLTSGVGPLGPNGGPDQVAHTSSSCPTQIPGLKCPSMQFVLSGVPIGGDGIVAVPHDKFGPVPPCENVGYQQPCIRPAFLQTSHTVGELDLLRYYNDFGSTLNRPFLVREVAYPLSANSGGTDSRGIAIDTSPRVACEQAPPGADLSVCARLPARVFFASRTPPSLVVGEIGGTSPNGDLSYDPDRLVITGNVPLPNGPSRVYLAPIVDSTGNYALRVFVTCYDASEVVVYDPDAGAIENMIPVGPGPFAMAFDSFNPNLVATRSRAASDTLPPGGPIGPLNKYRFAYVASFTQSYLQVIDLDNSSPTGGVTYERIVFTLGRPTPPKGS
jgi:hypothetical protein